jgi:hypothetical protein
VRFSTNKPKRVLTFAFVTLISAATAQSTAQSPLKPVYRYLGELPVLKAGEEISGPSRVLELMGRRGINPTSIHTSIRLGAHNLNSDRGTLTLWFFALEDLAASFTSPNMAMDNPHYLYYTFLTDTSVPSNYGAAIFNFAWNRNNELRARFFSGGGYWNGLMPPQKAWVQAVPFNYFQKHRWYQLAVTWDVPAKQMAMYVNGVLVGRSDRFNRDFAKETCRDILYTGCPALCHGEIEFFDAVLDRDTLYTQYRDGDPNCDPEMEKELRKVFEGVGLEDFDFQPGDDWIKQWDCDLKDAADVKEFYIQGYAAAVQPGADPEGLLVETPDVPLLPENLDKQVYLWSNRNFEGNLYVECEWKAFKPNGLSLLMIHASGMNREDFMADYPKRTYGRMDTVHRENVRNYHWEYYREMNDVRNDVASSFSRKNPFAFRNGFGSTSEPVMLNQWHKLQLVSIDGHVRGAIDGKVLLEFRDNSRTNTGCTLNYGHIAIRCMVHTKLLLRNLKVYTQKLPFTEVTSAK